MKQSVITLLCVLTLTAITATAGGNTFYAHRKIGFAGGVDNPSSAVGRQRDYAVFIEPNLAPPPPPPDTTPPVLSSPGYDPGVLEAYCGNLGLFQGGAWESDEPAKFKWRYGYGPKFATVPLGEWSSYTATYETSWSGWMNTLHQMSGFEWFKFEVMAIDAAGNTTAATYSGSFQASPVGQCP